MLTSTRKHPHLLNGKGTKRFLDAAVRQALKDLKDKNPVIVADAHDWIFSERAEEVFEGAGYFLDVIQWHVRLMIRKGTLKKAA
jgi:hypothetical protein